MNVTELTEYHQFKTTDRLCVRKTVRACLETMEVDDVYTLPDLNTSYSSMTTCLVWVRELNPTKGFTMKDTPEGFKVWRWK